MKKFSGKFLLILAIVGVSFYLGLRNQGRTNRPQEVRVENVSEPSSNKESIVTQSLLEVPTESKPASPPPPQQQPAQPQTEQSVDENGLPLNPYQDLKDKAAKGLLTQTRDTSKYLEQVGSLKTDESPIEAGR